VGPLARTAADILLAFHAMFDRGGGCWPSSTPVAAPRRVLRIEGPLQKYTESSSREALDRAHALLEANGIRVDTANLSSRFENVVACYETILFHDIASNHGGDRDRHGAAMSDRLREIIDSGRRIAERAYADAIADAQSYVAEIRKLLDEDSIILAPATNGTAPVFSEATGPSRLQGPWTLVGFPVLAAPCGTVDGLPVGVQLVAGPQREDLLARAGALFKAEWPGGRGDAQISGGPTPTQSTVQS
jgi:Asp-tRNA(Asn)/Glu-tRNA(Gln) amidotransferase A subunit family amidase